MLLLEKLNGKKLPLIAIVVVIAFNAGVTYRAKDETIKDLRSEMHFQSDTLRTLIRGLDEREARRNREMNRELQQVASRLGYMIRAIE